MQIQEIIGMIDGFVAVALAIWFIDKGLQQMEKQRTDFKDLMLLHEELIRDLCDKD